MNIRSTILASVLSALTLPAWAADQNAMAPGMLDDVARLQHEWARIKYDVADPKQQEAEMMALADEAKSLTEHYHGRAEPLIWGGIITSSAAGLKGGLGALGMVKDARTMLEQADEIDPKALDGSAKTSLGSLYYQVPGFPVGFGSNKKARKYLESALVINPDGIDSNFFYGDFLYQAGEYEKAQDVLRHALAAPDRPGREDADTGRRGEIQALLTQISKKLEKRGRS